MKWHLPGVVWAKLFPLVGRLSYINPELPRRALYQAQKGEPWKMPILKEKPRRRLEWNQTEKNNIGLTVEPRIAAVS